MAGPGEYSSCGVPRRWSSAVGVPQVLKPSLAYDQRMIEARKPKPKPEPEPEKCPTCGKEMSRNAKSGG